MAKKNKPIVDTQPPVIPPVDDSQNKPLTEEGNDTTSREVPKDEPKDDEELKIEKMVDDAAKELNAERDELNQKVAKDEERIAEIEEDLNRILDFKEGLAEGVETLYLNEQSVRAAMEAGAEVIDASMSLMLALVSVGGLTIRKRFNFYNELNAYLNAQAHKDKTLIFLDGRAYGSNTERRIRQLGFSVLEVMIYRELDPENDKAFVSYLELAPKE